MSTPEEPGPPGAPEFTEEELRALEAEMDRISVDDVLLQTVVSLVNLGARRAGLAGPEGPPADLEQTRQAIEGARALLPLLEARHGDQLGPVREALSRLQMAYVQQSGQGGAPSQPAEPGGAQPADPADPAAPQPGTGPAQSSGRLWVPGQ
ncbi:MAG: hypothetical protein QOF17_1104 [Solirubrobacteraceae bacterium]|jgi:hypothetical protein|nr:hypothetical protein [Solirubrobacteraceae bacterium]